MMYQITLANKYFDATTSTVLDFAIIDFEDKWNVELHYVPFRQSIHLVIETLDALISLVYDDCPKYDERHEDIKNLSWKLVNVLEDYVAYGNEEQGLLHETLEAIEVCWEHFR